MTHEFQKEMNRFEMIKVWIPLAIAIAGGLVTWGVFSQKLSANDIRLNNAEVKQEQLANTLTDVRLDVASIKTSVEFIKNRVK